MLARSAGSLEEHAMTTFTGTTGNDTLTGTAGNDTFNLSQGGNDTVQGLAGNDLFIFGATFTAADSVDGGAGADTLRLNGDYSAGVNFNATTMINVEQIQLTAGHSYALTTDDANVAAGGKLTVNGSALLATDTLNFNGLNETDGSFNIEGGAGNDTLRGSAMADLFNLTLGGDDHVTGKAGDDTFQMGAAFTANDRIDGGTGNDTVSLDGDYTDAHAVIFNQVTMINVETLQLIAGHSYDLTPDVTTVAAGQMLTVNAKALGAADQLTFDGSAIAGTLNFAAGAGNDDLTGSAGNDTFDLSAGGIDIVDGGGGSDTFNMGGTLTSADSIDGEGKGNVVLNGDYSGANALTFKPSTLMGIPTLTLLGAKHVYDITDSAQNDVFEFNGAGLGDSSTMDFDGSAEQHSLVILGGRGTNTLTGTAFGDTITVTNSLNTNVIEGGAGNDTISLVDSFAVAPQIDGGDGSDTVIFNVNAPANLTLGASSLVNVEFLDLTGKGQGFTFATIDANVAAGATLPVTSDADGTFDGSAETDGHFAFVLQLHGGSLIGGALSDRFDLTQTSAGKNAVASHTVTGGGGADIFQLGSSDVTFVYNAVSDSTGPVYDSISGANFSLDHFQVSAIAQAPTAIDAAVTAGSLSSATFNTDLAADIGAGQLGAHHAVLFTANAGGFAGTTFLIVDENGAAGYQADADLVIAVTASGTLTTANFT
jgi:Ca2+-binding RTX toxin-like protein